MPYADRINRAQAPNDDYFPCYGQFSPGSNSCQYCEHGSACAADSGYDLAPPAPPAYNVQRPTRSYGQAVRYAQPMTITDLNTLTLRPLRRGESPWRRLGVNVGLSVAEAALIQALALLRQVDVSENE